MKSVETILVLTDQQVDWMYDAWDFLVEMLDHENSFQRSIAINVLCNLAKSDKDNRLGGMLDRLLLHTKDEKFITSRQSLQSIWKIAITNERNREKIVEHLAGRYRECGKEKHYNHLRKDVLSTLWMIYKNAGEEDLLKTIQGLIREEVSDKYRKDYQKLFAQNMLNPSVRSGRTRSVPFPGG